jgi:hypothetical protein
LPSERAPITKPGEYWGTGPELSRERPNLDNKAAKGFLEAVSKRIFGDKFDYSLVEFRSLNHKVTLIVKTTGKQFEITPFRHLISEDGLGH